ncbi:hypothetical protein PR048_030805 [Dryococelus australis]|uniref:Uncharacterized protein n=1 Tax=Dryococelus australis TaxID=614101 RepID=A0ABQ9GCS0_9NEOP|nr:hypothetical protein PR048_030805 [Dryococelus australis]
MSLPEATQVTSAKVDAFKLYLRCEGCNSSRQLDFEIQLQGLDVTKTEAAPRRIEFARGGLWLDCSPPTKANRVRFPAGSSPNFRMWETCRTASFLGGLPCPPAFAFPALLHSPLLTPTPATSPSSVLTTSMLRAAHISSLTPEGWKRRRCLKDGCRSGKSSYSYSRRPGSESRYGCPDFCFTWFPKITPVECWDGSLRKTWVAGFFPSSSPIPLPRPTFCVYNDLAVDETTLRRHIGIANCLVEDLAPPYWNRQLPSGGPCTAILESHRSTFGMRSEVSVEQRWNAGRRGERENPEKTRPPEASSGRTTRANKKSASDLRRESNPVRLGWKTSALPAKRPRPQECVTARGGSAECGLDPGSLETPGGAGASWRAESQSPPPPRRLLQPRANGGATPDNPRGAATSTLGRASTLLQPPFCPLTNITVQERAPELRRSVFMGCSMPRQVDNYRYQTRSTIHEYSPLMNAGRGCGVKAILIEVLSEFGLSPHHHNYNALSNVNCVLRIPRQSLAGCSSFCAQAKAIFILWFIRGPEILNPLQRSKLSQVQGARSDSPTEDRLGRAGSPRLDPSELRSFRLGDSRTYLKVLSIVYDQSQVNLLRFLNPRQSQAILHLLLNQLRMLCVNPQPSSSPILNNPPHPSASILSNPHQSSTNLHTNPHQYSTILCTNRHHSSTILLTNQRQSSTIHTKLQQSSAPILREIVRHDSHLEKFGLNRQGIEPGSAWRRGGGGVILTAQPSWPHELRHSPRVISGKPRETEIRMTGSGNRTRARPNASPVRWGLDSVREIFAYNNYIVVWVAASGIEVGVKDNLLMEDKYMRGLRVRSLTLRHLPPIAARRPPFMEDRRSSTDTLTLSRRVHYTARIGNFREFNDLLARLHSPEYNSVPQMFVHWLLPQRIANVTPHRAVGHSLLVSLQACYWLRVVQGRGRKFCGYSGEGSFVVTAGKEVLWLQRGRKLCGYSGEGSFVVTAGKEALWLQRGRKLCGYSGEGSFVVTAGKEVLWLQRGRKFCGYSGEGSFVVTAGKEALWLQRGRKLCGYSGERSFVVTAGKEALWLQRGRKLCGYSGEGSFVVTAGKEALWLQRGRKLRITSRKQEVGVSSRYNPWVSEADIERAGMQVRGETGDPRVRPADQRHHSARFPHVRERNRREAKPLHLGGRRVV